MLDCQPSALGVEALDNPVLSSINANWKAVAERVGAAHALPEAMGPFAAMDEGAPFAADDLTLLVAARTSPVLVVHQHEIMVPRGLKELNRFRGVQLVPAQRLSTDHDLVFDTLREADAAEMLQLAQMTQPGPFAMRTHQLGDFIGLRAGGALVAMAGQRMGFAEWIEISAVCVHPDFRKRGYARQLVKAMVERIYQSGAKPFLHTFIDNTVAIDLYRSMGFEIRTEMNISQMAAER